MLKICRKKQIRINFFLLCICVFLIFNAREYVSALNIEEETANLQKQIEAQQAKRQELLNQQKIYQNKIDEKRKEALTLKNQLSILNSQLNEQKLAIKTKENELDIKNLEIKNTQFNILRKQKEISEQKNRISEVLRLLNQNDNQNIFQIFLAHQTISDVLSYYRYFNSLEDALVANLDQLKKSNKDYLTEEKNLENERQEIVSLKTELEEEKKRLSDQQKYQSSILEETRGAEWKFQSLLADAITEQKKIDNEITDLEKRVREKITSQKDNIQKLESEGEIIFSWPVPNNGITAYFHDSDYPYAKWIGAHSGVDLRASQGTTVRAAASGYIGKAKNGGTKGYSYILIIHNDKFSTLYGHVSQINVEEGTYVKRGQIIGKSGGLPGTSGAGPFCTGPHLHFEVRAYGSQVNPLDYLL